MSSLQRKDRGDCEEIRELIAWYPTGTLSDEESRRVECHVATCSSCTSELRGVVEFKSKLIKTSSVHPDPELLVLFAEDETAVAAGERDLINQHLANCTECAAELVILREVDLLDVSENAPDPVRSHESVSEPVSSKDQSTSSSALFVHLWETLTSCLLKPVPAAVYLVLAIVSIAHLYSIDGIRWNRNGSSAPERGGMEIGNTVVDGVILLRSKGSRGRAIDSPETIVPGMAIGKSHFILLEFTNLISAPVATDQYQIQICPSDSTEPLWSSTVTGASFSENYTLCLNLNTDNLTPGLYTVDVLDPAGDSIYQSMLRLE